MGGPGIRAGVPLIAKGAMNGAQIWVGSGQAKVNTEILAAAE
jgi:hypothetical protein